MMLFTERATRNSARSFVRYHDLLADWTSSVVRVGEELEIERIQHAGTRTMQEIHQFVDPQLHRVRTSWMDLAVPPALREIAEETWSQLNLLAEPGQSGQLSAQHTLDELRRAYGDLYAQAEAFAGSSVAAAGPAYLRSTRQERVALAEEAARAAYVASSRPRRLYLRARRLAGRIARRLDRLGAPKGD